jgi:hypothetical protein
MRKIIGLAPIIIASGLHAQTTQGLIAGRVLDLVSTKPVADAEITYINASTATSVTAKCDPSGFYVLPLLSPGRYRVRAAASGYQAQEVHDIELRVAARLELGFRLRPLTDVWEKGEYRSLVFPDSESLVTFYGPDVDASRSGSFEAARAHSGTLESTLSDVIDPMQLRELPLAGRDVYATLVLQPGVTADTTTSRGLGVSVNGQRPSSSNYLLDGVENDNYLITGPLTTVAPEAVQEYRVSTNNFSAEYGRTTGFVANAVTRSGGSAWHGTGYFNLENEILDANIFQRNAAGLPRPPQKEDQIGFQVGGPLLKNRLFNSTALDFVRRRSDLDPVTVQLPTTTYLDFPAPDSIAHKLLQRFPPPPILGGELSAGDEFSPPASLDRYVGLERLDYLVHGGLHRLMGRVAVSNVARPDFIWSPYKDFVSGLDQIDSGIVLSEMSAFRPNLTNDVRAGFSLDDLHWNRAHPEIPTMYTQMEGVLLPGSPASYAYRNRSRNWEIVDDLLWSSGRHIIKGGGGLLWRRFDGRLTFGSDGRIFFQDLVNFALDQPSLFEVSLDRRSLEASPANYELPQFNHSYRYNQYFFFLQDSFKASSRLALNYGVRYENFGAPRNVGALKDAEVVLGPGNSLAQSLVGSKIVYPGPGDQQLYASDNNDWSGRLGFAYALRENARTVVRGAFGLFYDRPFDNLWQNLSNNNFVFGEARFAADPTNYLAQASSLISKLGAFQLFPDFPHLTLFQPGIPNAYVHTLFLGVQQRVTESLSIEINTTASLGRKLITTDLVNRDRSLSSPDTNGRFNPGLSLMSYRGSQGDSDYNALSVVGRYRGRRSQFQLAYTWSHSIDDQSEPLANDFFNLDFTSLSSGGTANRTAAFARQFDSRRDRGSSDFDQRHNLVFFSIWELPNAFSASRAAPLFRNWRISQVAAFRSGFPFSVFGLSAAPDEGGTFAPNRADLIDPAHAVVDIPIPGGMQLLNPAAFRQPPSDRLGNTGRNAFVGPGVFNVDLSLSRSFGIRRLGEGSRMTIRADAFNFLNHANLNNPLSTPLGFPGFGDAEFGRAGTATSFPALTPFHETPRQIQLLLHLEF